MILFFFFFFSPPHIDYVGFWVAFFLLSLLAINFEQPQVTRALIICLILLLRNDLWKSRHFKSVYAICICSKYSNWKKKTKNTFLASLLLISVLCNNIQKRRILSYRNIKVAYCICIYLKQVSPWNCAWILLWVCSTAIHIVHDSGSRSGDLLVNVLTHFSILHICVSFSCCEFWICPGITLHSNHPESTVKWHPPVQSSFTSQNVP